MTPNVTPTSRREAALLAYFTLQSNGPVNQLPLLLESLAKNISEIIRSTTPYVLSMDCVYINVVHAVPSPNYILSIFNASLVALCHYDEEFDTFDDQLTQPIRNHWLDDPTLPMIMNST